MRAITNLSVRELAAAVSRREFSAEAVARAHAGRIATQEADVRAWRHFDAERVISQARDLDRAGGRGPLQGVPIGVKDLMDTADMPSTYGSPIYAGHRPPLDVAFLAAARTVDGARAAAAYALAERARCALAAVFRSVDVLLAPSAEGEAPAGLGATGNPIFNRMWALLGVPCVHVATGVGMQGLPVGVTVIGPRWGDAQTLAAAERLHRGVPQARS